MVKRVVLFIFVFSGFLFAQDNWSVEFNGIFVRPSEAESELGFAFLLYKSYDENTRFFVNAGNWNWGEVKNFRGGVGNDGYHIETYNNNTFYPVFLGIEEKIKGDKEFNSFFTAEIGGGYITYDSYYYDQYRFNDRWIRDSFSKPVSMNEWLYGMGLGFGISHRAWEVIDLRYNFKVYKLGGDYEKFGDLGSIYIISNFGIALAL